MYYLINLIYRLNKEYWKNNVQEFYLVKMNLWIILHIFKIIIHY